MKHNRVYGLFLVLAIAAPALSPGQEYKPIKSEIVKAFKYNADTQVLTVLFDTGAIREHEKVPLEIYQGLLDAPLKGGYYKSSIEKRFRFSEKNKPSTIEPSPEPDTKDKETF